MITSRREFIKQSAMGAALASFGTTQLFSKNVTNQVGELGLIVNVIEGELEKDWQGTLKKVADFGYRYLEFGDFYGPSMEEFLAYMKKIGLVPLAGGTSLAGMKNEDQFFAHIDDSLKMGKKYMVCYWPWMDGGDNKKLDDFKAASDELNKLGEICNKRGIRFLFHNHDKEFVRVEDYRWGYQVMLEYTDPKLVGMELDLYWITKGGGDPIYLFDIYPGRFDIFHIKDMDNSISKLYTCPGYGIINFAEIFARSADAGVSYYIVEIDEHPDPVKCIKDSYTYLKNLRF